MKSIKQGIEGIKIESAEDYQYDKTYVNPKIRIAISTYYKGTSLDGALKKIEEYIELSDEDTISVL